MSDSVALDLLRAGNWQAIEDQYEHLPERERAALDLRFGLRPSEPHPLTYEEIGRRLDMHPARVWDVEKRAVRMLDAPLPHWILDPDEAAGPNPRRPKPRP